MRPVLLDTSLYIAGLRAGDESVLGLRRAEPDTILWLSAVVLEELYAGATGKERGLIVRLARDFEQLNRIVVPNLTDWTETGRVLNLIGLRYGHEQIGRARLTNDALMALSAARLGIAVLTANRKDFARLAEIRPFRWELRPDLLVP